MRIEQSSHPVLVDAVRVCVAAEEKTHDPVRFASVAQMSGVSPHVGLVDVGTRSSKADRVSTFPVMDAIRRGVA